jgi:hypothetical protein
MNRDSMQQLRIDRRLIRRRGWISQAELKRELEAIPDVSDQMTTLGDVADERGREASPRPRGTAGGAATGGPPVG